MNHSFPAAERHMRARFQCTSPQWLLVHRMLSFRFRKTLPNLTSLCGFAKIIWEMGLRFLYCEVMKTAGPTIYYVTFGVCRYLGATPNEHLLFVNVQDVKVFGRK